MAQHSRLAKTKEPQRKVGDFVWTETAKNIRRSLDLVSSMDSSALTMIAGAPGSGKSTVVRNFCNEDERDAIYVQAAKGEGKIKDFAKNFFNQFLGGTPAMRSNAETREMLERYMRGDHGKRRILVVDEAQYLDQKNARTGQTAEVFEWLRAASENSGFKIVFCGDDSLQNTIARYPQLHSRMIRPVVIRSVSYRDIEALVSGSPFTSPEAQHALHAVAQLAGGLRNVENVLRIATAFAGEGQPTTAHLKAAIIDMQLAPRGVKKRWFMMEGVYICRGKTVAQMQAEKAEIDRKDAEPHSTVTLSAKEEREFEAATSNVEYLLHNAGSIFETLHSGFSSGNIDPENSGTIALLEMVGRGFIAAAQDEGVKCTQLSGKIEREKELINVVDE